MTSLIDEVKEYCKIDGSDEDVTIESFILAAKPFIESKTNYKFDYFKDDNGVINENPQARLALKMLCLHWYENREPVGSGELIAFSLNALIIHLLTEYGMYKYAKV